MKIEQKKALKTAAEPGALACSARVAAQDRPVTDGETVYMDHQNNNKQMTEMESGVFDTWHNNGVRCDVRCATL